MVLYGGKRDDLPGRRAAGCVLVIAANPGGVKPAGDAHAAGYRFGEVMEKSIDYS